MEKFTTKELISQADFSAEYEALLRDGAEATGVFSRYTDLCTPTISRRILINFIQTPNQMEDHYLNTMCIIRDEAGEKRWADLKARVVEHNIRSVRSPNHGTISFSKS